METDIAICNKLFLKLNLVQTSEGTNFSHLDKNDITEFLAQSEKFFGLTNFGNTCYCNSVLQALYFCRPFRERVLLYYIQSKAFAHNHPSPLLSSSTSSSSSKDSSSLLDALADLFYHIASQKKRIGCFAPKKFVSKLKKECENFNNFMQQDAHEFFNFLLNKISENLNSLSKTTLPLVIPANLSAKRERSFASFILKNAALFSSSKFKKASSVHSSSNGTPFAFSYNFLEEIFQGEISYETKCLNCENTSSVVETFYDISIDVFQSTSILQSLNSFGSQKQLLSADNKYQCKFCSSKQEAQRTNTIKKLPHLLALHLKRFQMDSQGHISKFSKSYHQVIFPFELHLPPNSNLDNKELFYDLIAVIVHCGPGLNRGHYISLIKSKKSWFLFDDDVVEMVDECVIKDYFGFNKVTDDYNKASDTAYILYYQAKNTCISQNCV